MFDYSNAECRRHPEYVRQKKLHNEQYEAAPGPQGWGRSIR